MNESLFDPSNQNADLSAKIVAGLERISDAFKVLLWEQSKTFGLSPIQIQILIFIAFHKQEISNVSSLAKEFNLTKPTISDAIRVLQEKKLVKKIPSADDGRAFNISLTAAGKKIVAKTMNFAHPLKQVVDGMEFKQKEETYEAIAQLIFQLHKLGVISVQRTCPSCKFFEKKKRHSYCHLLNMELRSRDIRLDCPEFIPLNHE